MNKHRWLKHVVAIGCVLAMSSLMATDSALKVSNVRMKQRTDSKKVDIYFDLSGGTGNRCDVTINICDKNSCIAIKGMDAVEPRKDCHFVWDAESDWANHFSTEMTAEVVATEGELPAASAEISFSTKGYSLSSCSYWTDAPTLQLSDWDTCFGSVGHPYYAKLIFGSSDSHKIVISPDVNKKSRRFRLHFNNWLETRSGKNVQVTAKMSNTTLSASVKAAGRWCEGADRSDPYVTVVFDENGQLSDLK